MTPAADRRPRVFVTQPCFDDTRALLSAHADVIVNESIEPLPRERWLASARDVDAILAFMPDRIDDEVLRACPGLRIVGAALKGFDNIDVAAATRAGVWVSIVPDLLTAPTAELAIGLMIAVSRHLVSADRRIRDAGFAGWRARFYGTGLAGSTVAIVGYGAVGRAIAWRLSGFGCRILVHDQRSKIDAAELPASAHVCALADALAESDFVVLALPLDASTQRLFDENMLATMKPGAYLVNPARGSLVDEAAVARALRTGRLAGYAADVFECEDWARVDRPASIHPDLIAMKESTVLTPHLGSAVEDVRRRIEESAARSIIDVLCGRPPLHAINSPSLPRRRIPPSAPV